MTDPKDQGERAPMEHHLKCVDPYFSEVEAGLKGYELRLNDRDYRIGDTLVLHHYSPTAIVQSGRVVKRKVVQMVRDFVGLAPGYVALGFGLPQPQGRQWGPEDVTFVVAKMDELTRYTDLRMTKGEWRDCGCVNEMALCTFHEIARDVKKRVQALLSNTTGAERDWKRYEFELARAEGLRAILTEAIADLEALSVNEQAARERHPGVEIVLAYEHITRRMKERMEKVLKQGTTAYSPQPKGDE